MGIATVQLQPELVIEHLVRWHSQPWEHRCEQFTCMTRVHHSLTSFTGWQL